MLSGVSVAAVVSLATGFFAWIMGSVRSLWEGFIAFLNSPFSWEHLIAGAGVLLIPIIIIVVIFALADN
ncbi:MULTISPECIES: hypothetical protein [Paenarthrobacter]|uniref:Uncharacterized protein n=1 Tax=Paenarthrobacter ureafaciens TaxID=37931 RepID=A0AAX3EDC5_PAEUR|nr:MULTISPECIES: hypothetical protein [Paenarthrobacter]NKR13328.1 hypothetical protein [Arthrobacter sp. M5]NKR14822.1 hypothetical protein [Arthrobacter sp. M6]OEH62946.1 hypothetical protein A5N17_09820 [Arthrobacter sp. D2]MDO5865120.1 hypothetical protein [Paenarthrobacter sp. SD-2]QMU82934.1 hypothetical protein FV140_13085 [Paenarthrobacter ureafaciens]